MKIHHLNCGTDCPVGGRLMDGRSKGLLARLVCHCLLVETEQGLVLVDTGYGLRDVAEPHPRLPHAFKSLLNIQLRQEETAIRQVERLGFSPADVRHIVLTHLDFDHAGGLEDFPNATIHLMEAEFEAFRTTRIDFVTKQRYRPMQIDDVRHWRRYQAGGEPWFGFEAVRKVDGLPPEILLIPLKGHTWGHAGVAIDTPQGWLLHAGDAYFYRDEVRSPERRCPPGLRAYQRMMEVDRESRLMNQQRLRALSLDLTAGVRMICAHDVVEYEACAAGRPL
ncbi:MAG TPA: MBL fold metallo-hydrolase [Caulobacteraceae bacterium]|nr:MBL fold metallo-hydrolase [Caulobacteraceae bacterium]